MRNFDTRSVGALTLQDYEKKFCDRVLFFLRKLRIVVFL